MKIGSTALARLREKKCQEKDIRDKPWIFFPVFYSGSNTWFLMELTPNTGTQQTAVFISSFLVSIWLFSPRGVRPLTIYFSVPWPTPTINWFPACFSLSLSKVVIDLSDTLLFLTWAPTAIIFTNHSARAGYDTRSIFKRSLTGLNSVFSFS